MSLIALPRLFPFFFRTFFRFVFAVVFIGMAATSIAQKVDQYSFEQKIAPDDAKLWEGIFRGTDDAFWHVIGPKADENTFQLRKIGLDGTILSTRELLVKGSIEFFEGHDGPFYLQREIVDDRPGSVDVCELSWGYAAEGSSGKPRSIRYLTDPEVQVLINNDRTFCAIVGHRQEVSDVSTKETTVTTIDLVTGSRHSYRFQTLPREYNPAFFPTFELMNDGRLIRSARTLFRVFLDVFDRKGESLLSSKYSFHGRLESMKVTCTGEHIVVVGMIANGLTLRMNAWYMLLVNIRTGIAKEQYVKFSSSDQLLNMLSSIDERFEPDYPLSKQLRGRTARLPYKLLHYELIANEVSRRIVFCYKTPLYRNKGEPGSKIRGSETELFIAFDFDLELAWITGYHCRHKSYIETRFSSPPVRIHKHGIAGRNLHILTNDNMNGKRYAEIYLRMLSLTDGKYVQMAKLHESVRIDEPEYFCWYDSVSIVTMQRTHADGVWTRTFNLAGLVPD